MQNDDNKRLHRQLLKKESFYQQMQKNSKRYFQFEQQVYYCPIKDINSQMIIKVQSVPDSTKTGKKKRQEFYMINGQYQPRGEKGLQKLILQIVQTIPRPKSAFGIIYINTLADSQAYNDFKKVIELLTSQYLLNLTKIYVLQSSFFNKAFSWLSFGTAMNYIKNKTVNVDNLRELSQQSHLELQQLKKLLPKNVVSLLTKEHEHQQKHQNNQHRGTVFQKNQEYYAINELPRCKSDEGSHEKPANIFTSPSQIRQIPSSKNKQMNSYQIGPTGAPIILQMLLYFFNHKQQYLKSEGLFRKSVSIDQQTQILQQLNNKNYNYLQTINDPHIIANAIKRFLSGFREPVIPFKIFDNFMNKQGDPQFNKIVVQSIKQLPKINKMILFLLFDFLQNSVLQYAQFNKMGLNNLCIVFGPCLMRAEVSSIKELIYAKKTIIVTSIIFNNFQQIYGDKNSQMKLKRNSYKQFRISQNKQRSSNKSIQPQLIIKTNETQLQPSTPTFNIIHKTSQFIKQSLENDQSEEQQDIEKQQHIQIINNNKVQQNQTKITIVNLFKSPLPPKQQLSNDLLSSKNIKIKDIAEKPK